MNTPTMTQPKPPYRVSKRTPEREQAILASIADGLPIKAACRTNGISEDAFSHWRNADPELEQRVTEALAASEKALFATVKAAGARDWRAHAWLLERRFATTWSPKVLGEVRHAHVHGTAADFAKMLGSGTAEQCIEVEATEANP